MQAVLSAHAQAAAAAKGEVQGEAQTLPQARARLVSVPFQQQCDRLQPQQPCCAQQGRLQRVSGVSDSLTPWQGAATQLAEAQACRHVHRVEHTRARKPLVQG